MARLAEVQSSILLRIVSSNRATEFGQQHGFNRINTVNRYREAVPVRTYEEFWPYIQRISSPESRVLTREPTLLFEPTSGSSQATKLIPYTKTLKREFHAAINPWLVDIYSNRPGLSRGRSYWSISPPVTHSHPGETSVPIGFDADSAYLSALSRLLVERTFVTPDSLRAESNPAEFYRKLTLHLLAAGDLSLVSIWNPTAFLLVLDFIRDNRLDLLRFLNDSPSPVSSPTRVRDLGRLLELDPIPFHDVWPRLRFISCWADGPNSVYANQLRALFPRAEVQGKGLIATEGIITIPFDGQCYLPAYQSHFLEFEPEGEAGHTVLVHELEDEGVYRVVITTSGGLYRYRLGDIVTVTGHHRGLPLIQFVARDKVLDHFGEKLNIGAVERVVNRLLSEIARTIVFVLFGFESNGTAGRYCLFVEFADGVSRDHSADLARLQSDLTAHLEANYHYMHARNLRQLEPLAVFRIASGGLKTYHSRLLSMGMKAGDIKLETVSALEDWSSWFDGNFSMS